MTIQTVIKENAYFDSVTLMTISTRANELAGVKTAMIGMGTDMNLEVIRNVGLYTPALDHVTTGDLLIVLDLDDQANSEEILQQVDELFTKKKKTASSEVTYKTLDSALHEEPDANLVVISVNGKFAAREAHKALDQQKHVILFSDNVTVDEELALKQKAHEKELFVMGLIVEQRLLMASGYVLLTKYVQEILELSALLVQAAKKLVSKSINMVMGFHN